MVNQGAFTAIVPIRPDRVEVLQKHLSAIGKVVDEPACPIRFEKLTRVHFMRWVVLDKSVDLKNQPLEPCLLLSTNFDGSLDDHLQELVAVARAELEIIYGHCVGFEAGTDLVGYLKRYAVPYAAFYVGTRGRSVQRIHQEQQLRNAIELFVDSDEFRPDPDPKVVRDQIRQFVRGRADLQWALTSEPAWRWYWFFYGPVLVAACLLMLLLLASIPASRALGLSWAMALLVPVGLLAAVVAVLYLAYRVWFALLQSQEEQERKNPLKEPKAVGALMADLLAHEDQIVQNQLTNVTLIKPTRLRRWTLRLVLFAINLLGRFWFTRGALGGIPSIHFARWVIFDRGRRLLFLSNFDGSWENYLGDFIDKAAVGLTAVWSNCVGCPPASGLAREGGARDEAGFKEWTRKNQLVTQVWYSAYEELSVENITNNSYLRVQLFRELNDDELRDWLARI